MRSTFVTVFVNWKKAQVDFHTLQKKWVKSETDIQCLIWGELLQRQQTPWGGTAGGRVTEATKPFPKNFPRNCTSPETALSISAPGHHSFGLALTCVCALSQFISFCASVKGKICLKVTVFSLYTVSAWVRCFLYRNTLLLDSGETCISSGALSQSIGNDSPKLKTVSQRQAGDRNQF